MHKITPAVRNLARRLTAFEAECDPSDGPVGAALRACEKLRVPLVKLLGVNGFRSLMSRALVRAKAEVPSLETVQLRPDGSLEGLGGTGRTHDAGAEVEILAQLLQMLVIFINEPLTLHLVRDAWPDAPLDESDLRGEGQS